MSTPSSQQRTSVVAERGAATVGVPARSQILVDFLMVGAILMAYGPLASKLATSLNVFLLFSIVTRCILRSQDLMRSTRSYLLLSIVGPLLPLGLLFTDEIDFFANLGLIPLASVLVGTLSCQLWVQWTPQRRICLLAPISLLLVCQLAGSQNLATSAWVLLTLLVAWWGLDAAEKGRTETTTRTRSTGVLMFKSMKTTFLVFALCIPLVIALFMLFPRIPLGLAKNLRNEEGRGTVGLSAAMAPGSISHLQKSNEPAFDVRFNGAPPAFDKLYWRTIVLSDFDGRAWTPMAFPAESETATRIKANSPLVKYTINWESGLNSVRVPTLDGTIGKVYVAYNDVFVVGVEVQPEGAYVLTPAKQDNVKVSTVLGNASAEFVRTEPSQASLDAWLQLPPGSNPRTAAWARALRSRFSSDTALVAAVLSRFSQDPFRYTLSPPALGQHSVDDFLFDTRAGFCEHYASAFVVILRSAGIPARVVTGYLGGSASSTDGRLEVMQRDAHAWAEYWTPGQGWVREDPTSYIHPSRVEPDAAGGRLQSSPNGVFGFARTNFSSLLAGAENLWRWSMLDFDQGSQRRLFRSLGLDGTNRWAFSAAVIAAALGLSILLSWLWTKRDAHGRRSKLSSLLDMVDSKLIAAGVARPTGVTLGAHCRALQAASGDPQQWNGLLAIARSFDSASYHRQSDDALKGLTRQLSAQIAQIKVPRPVKGPASAGSSWTVIRACARRFRASPPMI